MNILIQVWEVWNFVCWPISSCRAKNLKLTFFLEVPFMGQISAKYFFKIYCQKIFAVSFTSYIQLVPFILFTSFQQSAWITTSSFISIFSPLVAIHLVPNIWMKVKLTRLFHPNISILTTENGGRGTHFAKFLISPFQWGLTHSAFPHIGNAIFIPIHAPKIGKKSELFLFPKSKKSFPLTPGPCSVVAFASWLHFYGPDKGIEFTMLCKRNNHDRCWWDDAYQ